FTGLVFEWVLLWVRFNFHRTLFFPSIFFVLPCFGLHPMLVLVYQSVNRLLSRLSRIKPDWATKCRTKPQRGFVIFPAVVFFLSREASARNGYMRIQRTTFPQRACEAARRYSKQI